MFSKQGLSTNPRCPRNHTNEWNSKTEIGLIASCQSITIIIINVVIILSFWFHCLLVEDIDHKCYIYICIYNILSTHKGYIYICIYNKLCTLSGMSPCYFAIVHAH